MILARVRCLILSLSLSISLSLFLCVFFYDSTDMAVNLFSGELFAQNFVDRPEPIVVVWIAVIHCVNNKYLIALN